ncbi:MAG TPA: (Fe-S)-binding protein [Thermoanaerobaculaceae bacterium]|nr:(Fe-S)-binding protein [Thermoanaerobaculaceae bacterium]
MADRPVKPAAVEHALKVLRERLDERTATFLNACVRCGLCADTCHVYLADRERESMPAAKVERVARLFRRYHTLLGRLAPGLVAAEPLTGETLQSLAAAAFGRCTLCGRCALNCSVGLDPAAIMSFARTVLVAAGMVPNGIQANIEAARASGNTMSISPEEVCETIGWLEEDLRQTIGDPGASMPVDRKGVRVLYALNPRELKFFPLSISAAAMVFHAAGESWTLTSTDFDITNYGFFAGDIEAQRAIADRLIRRAEELGVQELVVAECGHGYRSLRWEAPEWLGRSLPFSIRSFVEVMAEYLAAGRLRLDPSKNPDPVTLHDPCNLVRHGGVIEEQRYLLRHAVTTFVEMIPNREDNYCCGGGGGLLAASEHTAKRLDAGKVKADQIRATGARVVASPCHNCIDQLMEMNRHYALGIQVRTLGEIVADALVLPVSPSS